MAYVVTVRQKQLLEYSLAPHLYGTLFEGVAPHERRLRKTRFEISANGDAFSDDVSVVEFQYRQLLERIYRAEFIGACVSSGLKIDPWDINPFFGDEYSNPFGFPALAL